MDIWHGKKVEILNSFIFIRIVEPIEKAWRRVFHVLFQWRIFIFCLFEWMRSSQSSSTLSTFPSTVNFLYSAFTKQTKTVRSFMVLIKKKYFHSILGLDFTHDISYNFIIMIHAKQRRKFIHMIMSNDMWSHFECNI